MIKHFNCFALYFCFFFFFILFLLAAGWVRLFFCCCANNRKETGKIKTEEELKKEEKKNGTHDDVDERLKTNIFFVLFLVPVSLRYTHCTFERALLPSFFFGTILLRAFLASRLFFFFLVDFYCCRFVVYTCPIPTQNNMLYKMYLCLKRTKKRIRRNGQIIKYVSVSVRYIWLSYYDA